MRPATLFATVYLFQGIAEPNTGLVTQPITSVLKAQGQSPAQIATFYALLTVPWVLKPAYGLISDFVPLARYRRKSYLIVMSALAAVAFLALFALPMDGGPRRFGLFVLVFLATVAVAFSDTVSDALLIETARPRGWTGLLQSVEWGAACAASMVTGALGGVLSGRRIERVAFLICGVLALGMLVFSLLAREERVAGPRPGPGAAWRALRRSLRAPGLLPVAAFLLLFNLTQFPHAVLNFHLTKFLGFSEEFLGVTSTLVSVAALIACGFYGGLGRKAPMGWRVHGSILLAVVSIVCYAGLSDGNSAVLVSLAAGFTSMLALLIVFDLAAQACPPEAAGTVFAALMAMMNLGDALSTWLGGVFYEALRGPIGPRGAFLGLVGAGALVTVSCWLLVPLLPRSLLIGPAADTPLIPPVGDSSEGAT